MISAGAQIHSQDRAERVITGDVAGPVSGPSKISLPYYIGSNTVIAKRVTIGDRCVIGANSLVLSDIPEGSKAFGTPCRVIGKVAFDASREKAASIPIRKHGEL